MELSLSSITSIPPGSNCVFPTPHLLMLHLLNLTPIVLQSFSTYLHLHKSPTSSSESASRRTAHIALFLELHVSYNYPVFIHTYRLPDLLRRNLTHSDCMVYSIYLKWLSNTQLSHLQSEIEIAIPWGCCEKENM